MGVTLKTCSGTFPDVLNLHAETPTTAVHTDTLNLFNSKSSNTFTYWMLSLKYYPFIISRNKYYKGNQHFNYCNVQQCEK